MMTPRTARNLLDLIVRELDLFGSPQEERDSETAALLRLNRTARWLSDLAGAEHTRRSLLERMAEQQQIADGGVLREQPLARQRVLALQEQLHGQELVIRGLMEDRPA